jgi:hypothetical protein
MHTGNGSSARSKKNASIASSRPENAIFGDARRFRGPQMYECRAYYEDHRGEIDLLVAQQMARDQW